MQVVIKDGFTIGPRVYKKGETFSDDILEKVGGTIRSPRQQELYYNEILYLPDDQYAKFARSEREHEVRGISLNIAIDEEAQKEESTAKLVDEDDDEDEEEEEEVVRPKVKKSKKPKSSKVRK